MKQKTCVFGVIVLLCIAATPAQAADPGWRVRVFAAGFDPDLDVVGPAENPDEVRVTADSDLGFGASLEYQFSSLLGVELGIMQASPEIKLTAEDIPGYGDIHLTDEERTTPGICRERGISEKFWLLVAGGKYDFTAIGNANSLRSHSKRASRLY